MTESFIRILLLLATFATVFLVSQVILGAVWRRRQKTSAVNKRLRMIRRGEDRAEIVASLLKNTGADFSNLPPFLARWLTGLQGKLVTAGAPFTLPQAFSAMTALFVGATVIIVFLARSGGLAITAGIILLALVIATCVGFVLPLSVIGMISDRRRKRVEQQFPIALDVFVRALRSGHPIASAIELVTTEMEDPIGSEFGIVSDEVAYGADLTDALASMAERWNSDDMRMFVVSLGVQSETGGNLAEILDNLAEVIRARASIYMKVRALSSEGRMTGWMLTVLPVLAFVSMFVTNPQFYIDVARDSIFLIGFPGLIVLYFIGVFTIRRMIDLKV